MFITASRTGKKIVSITFLSIVLFGLVWPAIIVADDHKKRHDRTQRDDDREDRFRIRSRDGNQEKNEDQGHEITGQTTAWLLVAGNLTIALSLLLKAVMRHFPLKAHVKNSIKQFNQRQKKHLMRFHYLLNPAALGMACFHFLLSSCSSSSLPEWAMIMVFLMVLMGTILKLQRSPKGSRRFFYRLHTTPLFIMITIGLLVVGHQLVD